MSVRATRSSSVSAIAPAERGARRGAISDNGSPWLGRRGADRRRASRDPNVCGTARGPPSPGWTIGAVLVPRRPAVPVPARPPRGDTLAPMTTTDPARHLAARRHPQRARRRRLSGGRRPPDPLADPAPLRRADPIPPDARRARGAGASPGHRPPLAGGAGRRPTSSAAPSVRYTSIPLLADDPTPHSGLAGMYRHVLDARGPSSWRSSARSWSTTACPRSSAARRARTGRA